ncbi:MAG TPA: ubiquinol-cytochrome c reductase cytochrome b subunit [Nocardioidaceae bacterium]|nr:ubiquinol-cytochrome c reductase cytochrome b subunit [Nocardioidaceae bacterium]
MSILRSLRRFDERMPIASMGRTALSKVFPDHWSFMLGEIALYSFMLLVATGVFLTFFFVPSTAEQVYTGSYAPLHGEELSSAYASTVSLSWDVRGGLLMRQAHHWAAHIFIGAIVLHLCRIFFTGMFRRPRELNWMVGVTLLALAMINAFAGYSLPDDLLSGTGLHIFFSVVLAVPVVGAWLAFFIFGGDFPGEFIIERLYVAHILLIPVLIGLLIAVHLAFIIRQKHTHFRGPGRSNANVVGSRMWPTYALRSMALLFFVAAVTFFLGAFAQINPVWVWGDFETATILSPSVADWYVAWVEGALRLFPPIEFTIFGHLVANQFWAGTVLPGLTFLMLYAWPFLDRRITGDRGTHHVTGRPRDCPIRVAIGVAALTFYTMLLIAGGQEMLVQYFGAPVGTVRAVLRGLTLGLPFLTGAAAYGLANALRRSEQPGLMQLSRTDLVPKRRRDREDGDGDGPTPEQEAQERPDQRPLSEVPSWMKTRSGGGK